MTIKQLLWLIIIIAFCIENIITYHIWFDNWEKEWICEWKLWTKSVYSNWECFSPINK